MPAPPPRDAARIDPGSLGLAAAFAAIAPIVRPRAAGPRGFLLVADRRAAAADPGAGARCSPTPRRSPRRSSRRDLAAAGPRAAGAALQGAIRPRAAAQRMVEAALRAAARRRAGRR